MLLGVLIGATVAAYGVHLSWPHPAVIAVGAAVVVGAVVVISTLVSWRRAGGRESVEQIDRWARSGRLPSDVPLGATLSRIAGRIDSAKSALWSSGVMFVLWAAQFAFHLADPAQDRTDVVVFGVAFAYFAATLAWTLYAWFRRVPALRDLLRQGQLRLAPGAPAPGAAPAQPRPGR